MSFVHRLHTSLALGTFGVWVLGICAVIWRIDCFVRFYLSLPQRAQQAKRASANNTGSKTASKRIWWQRWRLAWKIRWQSSNTTEF